MIEFFKSPMCYCGCKYKLLKDIVPLFPKSINTFVDLFCGGLDVSLNVDAKQIISNDIIYNIIDLYKCFKSESVENTIDKLKTLQSEFKPYTQEGYNAMRKAFNMDKDSFKLFLLTRYAYGHLIRFNSNNEFNTSFNPHVKEYVNYADVTRMLDLLHSKDISFTNCNFVDFDFSVLSGENDFLYCDPPYLVSCGVYQDGKRGFEGWNEQFENALYSKLSELNDRGVKFAISNIMSNGDMKNEILADFVDRKHLSVVHLKKDYNGLRYAKGKEKVVADEVLVTNYPINQSQQPVQLSLF